MPDQDQLMTCEETAEMLQIKPGTLEVWRCRRTYPLPWIKVGRIVRYRKSDVLDFIEKRCQRPVALQA